MGVLSSSSFFNPHPRTFFSLLLERAEGRERKKHQCETEALIACLSYAVGLGIKPTTGQDHGCSFYSYSLNVYLYTYMCDLCTLLYS